MEDEPGLGSPSECEKLLTFSEIADEQCPLYMSIGVPRNEFWHGDYTQLAEYRKAFEQTRERANYDAWLQGAYIYDALCAVAPVLHAFAKSGAKPIPYHKEPYGAKLPNKDAPERQQKTEEEIRKIQAHNASARFASFAAQWNKQLESKGGEADGSDN